MSAESPTTAPIVSQSIYRIGLLVAFVVALVIRLIGIDYGLPQTQCRPDEIEVLGRSLRMLTGHLEPHFYNYPSLFLYLAAAITAVTYAVVRAKNGSGYDVVDFFHSAWARPEYLFLPVRIVVAVFGAATCLVVAKTARRLFGESAGLAAAFLLAGAHLHVRSSHFALTDVPAAFFLALAADAAVSLSEKGRTRDYVMTALSSGLAASTKYFGAFMTLTVAVLWIVDVVAKKTPLRRVFMDRRPLLAAGTFLLSFFLTSPFVFLRLSETHAALAEEAEYVDGGYQPITSIGFRKHLEFTLPYGIGYAAMAAAAVGIVILIATKRRAAPAILVFPIVYYFVAGGGYTVFVRYFLPVVPFLEIAAAAAIATGVGFSARRFSRKAALLTLATAIGAVGFESYRASIAFCRMASMTDTRVSAAEWIEKNIPHDRSIAQFAASYTAISFGLPLRSIDASLGPAAAEAARRRTSPRFDFDPQTAGPYRVYEFDPAKSSLVDDRGEKVEIVPDVVLIIETFERRPFAAVRQKIESSGLYRRAAEFMPSNSPQSVDRFDRQDSFFIPYRDYRSDERPGPEIVIFVKKS